MFIVFFTKNINSKKKKKMFSWITDRIISSTKSSDNNETFNKLISSKCNKKSPSFEPNSDFKEYILHIPNLIKNHKVEIIPLSIFSELKKDSSYSYKLTQSHHDDFFTNINNSIITYLKISVNGYLKDIVIYESGEYGEEEGENKYEEEEEEYDNKEEEQKYKEEQEKESKLKYLKKRNEILEFLKSINLKNDIEISIKDVRMRNDNINSETEKYFVIDIDIGKIKYIFNEYKGFRENFYFKTNLGVTLDVNHTIDKIQKRDRFSVYTPEHIMMYLFIESNIKII